MSPCRAILLTIGLVAPALAQISVSVQQGTRVSTAASGSTVTVTAPAVGRKITSVITLTYTGSEYISFPSDAQFVGSSDFSLQYASPLPTLRPFGWVAFTVEFTPRNSQTQFGQFSVAYQLGGATVQSGFLVLNVTGVTPDVAVNYALATDANSSPLEDGSAIDFKQVLLNASLDATVSITNQGSASSLLNAVTLDGEGFQILQRPLLPRVLSPGNEIRFLVRFTPRAAAGAAGSLHIAIDDRRVSASLAGTGIRSVFSYEVIRGDKVSDLLPSQRIEFGDVKVGERSSVIVRLRNSISVPVSLNAISISGSGLGASEGPIFPLVLQPREESSFRLIFLPQEPGEIVGRVAIGQDSFSVTGKGIGPRLQLSYKIAEVETSLGSGGTAAFPTTAVGETVSARFTLSNVGTGPFPLFSLALADTSGSWAITNGPALPAQLLPDETLNFGINFKPQTAGKLTATLDLNGSPFVLSGFGSSDSTGSPLQFSYRINGPDFPVTSNGVVTFPSTPITQITTAQFTITNRGPDPASVLSVGLTDTSSAFRLAAIPNLPAQIPANQSISFPIEYRPQTSGSAAASLAIDGYRIALSGFAPAPPPLPAYRFTGASGRQEPFQQPFVGISLASSYPIALQGILTLTVTSDNFFTDPAVQFSSGGRTVPFSIPANELEARFPGGLTQIQLQTGSVASSLILSPTFTTSNGLDLTPANPTQARIDVPKLAPVLLAARIGSQTDTSLSVIVTGYATTRSLQSLEFSFQGDANLVFKGTVDVSAQSRLWFQNSSSQASGGQFSIEVPFTLRSDSSPGPAENLVSRIKTITVKATNELGSSGTTTIVVP